MCVDYGYKDDPDYNHPGFDPTASCATYLSMFCASQDSNALTLARTNCPRTCQVCSPAALPPCDDFYEINANCPVHSFGHIIPDTCDGEIATIDAFALMFRVATDFHSNARLSSQAFFLFVIAASVKRWSWLRVPLMVVKMALLIILRFVPMQQIHTPTKMTSAQ